MRGHSHLPQCNTIKLIHIESYVGDTMIYTFILRLLSYMFTSDGIAESEFDSNELLVFEVAHEAHF